MTNTRTQELTIGFQRNYQTTEDRFQAEKWVSGFEAGVEEVVSKVENPSDTGWYDPSKVAIFLQEQEPGLGERIVKVGLALRHLNPSFLQGFFPGRGTLEQRLAHSPRLAQQTM